jgi:GT2 family glycosyltransferase
MRLKVSIILVNWNGWNDTIKCIESLLYLNYHNFEIIIVDNYSEDNSIHHIRKWCTSNSSIMFNEIFTTSTFDYRDTINPISLEFKVNITLIKSHTNLGYSGGNNIGIQFSLKMGAQYFWLLNNDTTVTNTSLNKLIERAVAENNNIILSSHIFFADNIEKPWFSGGIYIPFFAIAKRVDYDKFHFSKYQFLTGCALFIPRKIFETIGYLDDSIFLYAEDVDFSIKAKRSGFKLDIVFESKVFHSVSSSSKKIGDRAYFLHLRNMIWVMRKNHGNIFLLSILPFHLAKLSGLVILRKKPVSFIKFYLLGMLRGSLDSLN